jgi:transposase
MPGLRIAKKTREEMALLMASGATAKDVATAYKCHLSVAYSYKQNDLLFGDPLPPPLSVQGRPRKMTQEAKEGLIDWLLENAEDKQLSYRDEMRHFIADEYGIDVSVWTIGRMLKEAKISYKKVGFLSI